MTALLMFGGFALLLILGVPIALSLGVSTMAAIAGSPDITVSINTVAQRIFGGLDSTSIMAIAFFVLSGNLMTKGGISRRICEFARSIIGGVRGGMALTLVLACAFFAALSGSAPATVVAIGTMLYGDMVRMGYPGDRTAGLLVVSGGLGPHHPAEYHHGRLRNDHRRLRRRYVQVRYGHRHRHHDRSDDRGRCPCAQGAVAER